MNIADALARATEELRAAGIDSARLDARVLLAHVLGVEPNEITSHPPLEGGSKFAKPAEGGSEANFGEGSCPDAARFDPSPKNSSHALSRYSNFSTLPQGEGKILAQFESLIHRRAAREPVAYITGRKGFWDLEFGVGPGALVPRPETETLIEQILKTVPDRNAPLKILDLGTGTGCILLTLLHLYPKATGLGVDATPEALQWAKRNAARFSLESRAGLRLANWSGIDETGFDIVVSNPPYLSADDMEALQPELAYEPKEALAGGPDGLSAYRAIAALLPHLLAPKGWVFLEIGMGQGPAVSAILEAAGLEIRSIATDLSGIPRCVTARMMLAAS
jgi:release factor glutamine methyltransferase